MALLEVLLHEARGRTEAGLDHFPMVNDLASLLWVVNLGCIDLNPCYARCDDVDRAGSRGIHIYVPVVRGPTQKQVWSFAKELARILWKPLLRRRGRFNLEKLLAIKS